MLSLKQTVLLLCFIHFCNGNNGLQKPGRSLVIVFDVTSSMTTEIDALIAGVQILLDDFVSRKNNPFENYIFVQFRDEFISLFISSNYNDVKKKIQTLGINDGKNGDCAESSYNGIKRGLEVTNEDSIFFIITGAATKRHELLPEIHRLIAEKRAQLYFFVSMGRCDQKNVLLDYHNLAAISNGILFQIVPEEINDTDGIEGFAIPKETFKVVLHGKDLTKNIIDMFLTPNIGANRLMKPGIKIVPMISVKEGEPIYLICVVISAANVTMSWSKVGVNSELKSFSSIQSNILNYTINKAEPSDAGYYKCTAENILGVTESISKVKVLAIPFSVNIEQTSITIPTGEQFIELKCDVLPNFPSVINTTTWLFNQKTDLPKGSELNGTNLILRDIKPKFSGIYTCLAVKNTEQKSANILLNVQYPPKFVNMLNLATNTSIDITQPIGVYDKTLLNINCSAEGNPEPSVKWIKNTVESVSNTSVLNINGNDVTQSGSYSCQIKSTLDEVEQKIIVDIVIPPKLLSTFERIHKVKLGGSFKLECPLEIIPNNNLTITWFQNRTFLNQDSYLTWPNVNHDTNGEYKCVAENKGGKVDATIHINVIYEPGLLEITKADDIGTLELDPNTQKLDTIQVNVPMKAELKNLSKGSNKNEIYSFGLSVLNHIKIPDNYFEADYQQHISINETETLILDCTMSGHPVPSIQWYKNNKKLDTQKGSIAIYKNATIQDSGIYKCIGSQKLKKIRILFYVLVRQMFSIDSLTSSQSDYNVGDVISIYCKAKGNPIPVITFSGPKLSTNSEPTIKILTNGANYFQQQNETFYTNKQKKIIDVKDLVKEAQYNIITYEFRDGQFVATLNHRIKSATHDHQGNYTCSVFDRNNKANKIRENIRINMLKPPYVDESAAKSVYFIQENVKEFPIDCPIKGTPTPPVEWFCGTRKLSKSKTFDPKGNQLRIERPSTTKTGEYSCKHVTTSLEYKFKIQIIQSKVDLTKANLKNFKQKDIFIEKGETKQLNCTFGGTNIFWNEISDKNNKREAYQLVVNPVYTIVGDLPRTLMCSNKNEPTYGELFNITVLGKPKIVATDDNLKIMLGTNFTLNCEAIGNPEPTTNWYKNVAGKWEHISKVTDFQQTSKFVVTKLKAQTLDESQYKCVAENRFGNVTKKFTVKVLDESHYFTDWGAWSECSKTCGYGIQKRSRQCIYSSCNFMIDSREQGCKIVDCPLHGEDPTINITESLLTPNVGANRLTKPGATIVPTISVKEGEPIYLICVVISAANVTMSWSKVGVNSELKSFSSIQSNILNYTINKAEPSDAGDYKCTAENIVGVTESISKVKVLAIPFSVNIEQTSITIPTGEQFIELKCDVLPNFPSVIITTTWLFNQKTDLPQGSELNGTNLILRDIKPKFSGIYTCLAVKNTEQKSANVLLNVQYPPKFVNMLNLATNTSINITQPIGVYDKTLLNINCSAEGNPEPSVKWIKNTVESVSNTSVLNINGNDVTQSGSYSCQIKSTLDEVEQKIIVDIVIPPKLLSTFKRIHKVKLGGSFKLECPLEIIPNNNLTITWFQNRTLLNQDSYLTWPNVNHDTNGEYKCVAENKGGKVDATIHINVIYEPSILKITKADDIGTLELDPNTQKLDIFNTSTLSLTCTVNGNPEPIISWIKEGNIISTGKTITLNDTTFGFTGLIECSAQNELKSVSRTITLNEIKIPKMQDAYQNVYNLTEHQPFTVSCPVEFGEYEVTWTLNGKSLEHFKQTDNSILINSVTETGMDGNAVCKATNKAGTVWANLTFDVLRAPYDISGTANNKTTLMENKTLEITCVALGNPTPKIYWSKDNQHHSNISSISFTSLQSKDTANYTCTAINILGKQSKTFEVIVGFPPRIPYAADLHRTATNTNITVLKLDNLPNYPVDYYNAHYKKLVRFNIGDDILLKCPINGYPEPKIEWSNNSNILNWSNKTLRFDNIAISDNGIYKCVGTNPYGQLEIVFFLSAQVKFIDTNKPFEIFDHLTHHLLCVYEGISSKIRWSPNTQTIVSNSPILILNGSDTSKSGDYYCQIETDSGMKTQPLNIDVVIKVKPLDSYDKILEAQLGHPLVLECPLKVISNNKWNITWYHNGMLVHQNTAMDNKYNIPSVGHNDKGIYKCRTENKAGSMEIVLTVNVTYEPNIINLERIDDFGTSMVEPNQNLLEIYNTSSFRLVCHVNGNPNPTTIWKKNNFEISMTHELNIDSLTMESLDKYQCFTKNKLNSAIRDLTLKVITKPSVLPNYPKLVKLTENETFTMTCPMKNGDFNVKWFLDENSIDTYKQSNESIKFNVVTPNLAGDVTCIATNKAGSTKAAFKFDVLMAPYDIVTTTKHNQIVNVSSNLFSITLKTTELLDLTCNAKGNPSPEIYWHKDGQQFSHEKFISIASVTSDDRGNYVCIAKNYLGEKTDSFDVIINSRPQLLDEANFNNHQGAASVSISVKNVNVAKEFFDADYQRNIEFNVGDQISLDCRMDGNPPPEINWFKNDIRVNERNQILVKLKSTPDDAGIYKCIRTNRLGATKVLFYVNEVINLVNNIRPIEIYDQAVKYIMCAYSGKTTNVKWINQNGETISKTPVLTIDGNDANQTGEYICQMGTRDQNILVEVTVKPELLSSYPHEHSIKLGEPFTLPCPLVVVPGNKIDIKWSHNNLNLQNFNQNVSLRFPSVSESDNGIYKCTAKNKAGIVDAEIKLDILYGPSILKIERSDDLGSTTIDPNEEILEVYNTKSFNLICHAYGKPAPSTIWKKDGIEISSTFILNVNHTTQFSGDYECFTENTLSSAVKSIKLKKIESPKALSNYSPIIELVLKKSFTMSCPMESGEYNVTWLLDNDSIDRFKQPDQTIAIDSVKSKMKGKVKCIATNKAGSAFAVFDFEIFEPPINIRATLLDLSPINSGGGPYQNLILLKENDSFGLICTSGGNPLPDFRWYYNQQYINKGKTLSFPLIQFHDSGDYMCIATNLYGTLNITYTIQVNVPMKAELKNLSKGSNKNEIYSFGLSVLNHIKIPDNYFEADYQQHISINETETLILDCTMSGHPVPSIQWYKNNKKLDTQKGSIAIYKNATIQDSGIYKCIGSQKLKKIRILFYVLVRQMFSIDSLTSQSDYNVGDVISIYCKAKGNPIPVITFLGPKLSSNSEPTITILTNGANYFKQQNETFYMNKQRKIIDVNDLAKEAQYNIITYEFREGQFVATLNHRIKSATHDHQGTYTCSVFDRNNKANKIRERIKINILKPPYVDESAAKSVYFIQENVKEFAIDCPIKGTPTPLVEWFCGTRKLSKSKTFDPKGNQLRIERPSTTKTGEYSCKHVTTSLEYKFKIQIIQSKVDLTKANLKNFKQKDIFIEKGETKQLNCTFGGKHIFWKEISDKNNKREAYQLVVNPVYTIVGDLPRTLMCSNENEPTYGELFNITVLGKPKIVATDDNLKIKLGTNFTLNCEAIGNPEPTTNWYKNVAGKWEHISKVTDFQQTSKFVVTKLKAQTLDASQYKCVAENRFGNVTKNFTVKVLDESNFFTDWGVWSECSKTCGDGIQKRSRQCIHSSCNFMTDSREQGCKIGDCPRHGGWSNWEYSKCSKSCLHFNSDESLTLARRKCNNPTPALGGRPCIGQRVLPRTCYVPFCQSNMQNLTYTKCAQLAHECCPDEFQYNNITKTCEEIRPCERKGPNSVCHEDTQICKGTGTEAFQCECMPGFKSRKKITKKLRCFDVNECRQNPNPCGNEICINTLGSFYCIK